MRECGVVVRGQRDEDEDEEQRGEEREGRLFCSAAGAAALRPIARSCLRVPYPKSAACLRPYPALPLPPAANRAWRCCELARHLAA